MTEVRLIDSIADVPASAWNQLAPPDDPTWSWSMFRAVERSALADGFAYITVSRGEELVSILPAFWLSRWRLDDNMSPLTRSLASQARRLRPRFMTAPALFGGNVLGAGHWLGLENIGDSLVRKALKLLRRRAEELGLTWFVLKDYTKNALDRVVRAEGRRSYAVVPALPDTVLSLDVDDFEGYLAGLNLRARRNARNKMRRFERTSSMRVGHVTRYEPMIPEMMRLYEQVYRKAEFRFDQLNQKFFENVLHDPAIDKEVVACWDGDSLVAFALCLFCGKGFVNLRIGMDYDRRGDSFAYFMLHYESIRRAFSRHCTTAGFSITTYDPKIELGCRLRPLFHAMTHQNALVRPLFVKAMPAAMARFDVAREYAEHVLVGVE